MVDGHQLWAVVWINWRTIKCIFSHWLIRMILVYKMNMSNNKFIYEWFAIEQSNTTWFQCKIIELTCISWAYILHIRKIWMELVMMHQWMHKYSTFVKSLFCHFIPFSHSNDRICLIVCSFNQSFILWILKLKIFLNYLCSFS